VFRWDAKGGKMAPWDGKAREIEEKGEEADGVDGGD
jgi:hypothetical protein